MWTGKEKVDFEKKAKLDEEKRKQKQEEKRVKEEERKKKKKLEEKKKKLDAKKSKYIIPYAIIYHKKTKVEYFMTMVLYSNILTKYYEIYIHTFVNLIPEGWYLQESFVQYQYYYIVQQHCSLPQGSYNLLQSSPLT